MNANATTPAIITINPNRELRKDQWKEMALQQQSHIGLLMKRLEMEKDMYSSMFHEKLDQEKELEALRKKVLTDEQLKALQDEAYKAGRACGYEDAESEFEPYKKQRELDALRDELAEIKEGKFDCDVYWSAMNGEITLYKIPNDVACLNSEDGTNAVLDAFQNGYFGEEWGSYSKLEVVELTREKFEEEYSCAVFARQETEPESESEPERPKSHKDIAIDELNEFLSQTSTTLRMTYDEELVRTEEPPAPAAPAFEPIPEGHTQVVVGSYCVEFTWKVPAGINLNDTETYEFWDRWGCLRIRNKITDEMTEVEEHDETDDFKEANDLELHLEDEEGCRV